MTRPGVLDKNPRAPWKGERDAKLQNNLSGNSQLSLSLEGDLEVYKNTDASSDNTEVTRKVTDKLGMAPRGNETVKLFIQQALFKCASEFPYIKFNPMP